MHFVDERGDEVVCVVEGVAEVYRSLDEEAGALVEIVRYAVEFAGDGLTGIQCRANRQRVISD